MVRTVDLCIWKPTFKLHDQYVPMKYGNLFSEVVILSMPFYYEYIIKILVMFGLLIWCFVFVNNPCSIFKNVMPKCGR